MTVNLPSRAFTAIVYTPSGSCRVLIFAVNGRLPSLDGAPSVIGVLAWADSRSHTVFTANRGSGWMDPRTTTFPERMASKDGVVTSTVSRLSWT